MKTILINVRIVINFIIMSPILYLKNLSFCKWHLLKFVRIPTNEKMCSIFICDLGMPKNYWLKEPTIGNSDSCFPPLKRTFNLFNIHMIMSKRQQLPCWQVLSLAHYSAIVVVSNMSKLLSTSMFCSTISNSIRGCKCWWHFKNIRKKDVMSYSWTIENSYSWPIKNETNLRFLNLGSNIRDNMLCVFFAYFFKENRKWRRIKTFFYIWSQQG
jgi:hypothetical protein